MYKERIQQWVSALSQSERMLVLMAALVGIYFLWSVLIMGPLHERHETIILEKQVASEQLEVLQDQYDIIQTGQKKLPKYVLLRQQAKLKTDLNHLREHVGVFTGELVQPTILAKALKNLFKQVPELTLTRIESLPVTALKQGTFRAINQGTPQLYQHGMVLAFQGDYFSVLRYLQKAEAMESQIFWDGVDYKVAKYPLAQVTLRLHTLSGKTG